MSRRSAALRTGGCLLVALVGCHGSQPRGASRMAASHLVVKLSEDCRLDEGRAGSVRLADAGGGTFDPASELPAGARVEHRVPELGRAPAASLSAEEAELARTLQILFPTGSTAGDYLRIVERWPCVESVALSPEVALPGSG